MSWIKRHPVRATLFPSLLLTAIFATALWYGLSREWLSATWLLSWLVAANVVTLLAYGVDKSLARGERWRVPEATLLILAFVGGSFGAFLGMRLFRHKTLKGSFRTAFWLLVAAQAVLLVVLVRYVWLA